MSTLDNHKFHHLYNLIFITGKAVLDTYISDQVLSSNGTTLTTIVDKEIHRLFHLWRNNKRCCRCKGKFNPLPRRILCRIQWDKLFNNDQPNCGNGRCICEYRAKSNLDFKDLDITLETCLMLNCLAMSPQVRLNIEKFRGHRNCIDHTSQMQWTGDKLDGLLKNVSACIMNIARECSVDSLNRFKREICPQNSMYCLFQI